MGSCHKGDYRFGDFDLEVGRRPAADRNPNQGGALNPLKSLTPYPVHPKPSKP